MLGAALLGVGAPQPLPRPWEGVRAAKAPGGSPCTQRHPWVHGAAGNGGVPTQPPPSPCTRGAARATWDPAQCPPGPGTALRGCGHGWGQQQGGRGAPGTPTASLPKAGSGCGGGQAAGQCGMEAATVRSPPRCRLKKSHPGGRRVEFSPPSGCLRIGEGAPSSGASPGIGAARPHVGKRSRGDGTEGPAWARAKITAKGHRRRRPLAPGVPRGSPAAPFWGWGSRGGTGAAQDAALLGGLRLPRTLAPRLLPFGARTGHPQKSTQGADIPKHGATQPRHHQNIP